MNRTPSTRYTNATSGAVNLNGGDDITNIDIDKDDDRVNDDDDDDDYDDDDGGDDDHNDGDSHWPALRDMAS